MNLYLLLFAKFERKHYARYIHLSRVSMPILLAQIKMDIKKEKEKFNSY